MGVMLELKIVRGDVGHSLASKYTRILHRNPENPALQRLWTYLKAKEDFMLEVVQRDVVNMQFCPPVSVDVERSFQSIKCPL